MNTKFQKRRQAGTAMVETALTLSLFLAILFSLFDFGYILFLHQTITARVAAAARYGSLHPADTTAMKNLVLYNAATGSGTGLFGLTAANVSATRTGTGTDERVVVTVSGFKFAAIAPAMRATGKPITVSIPVEGN